MESETSINKSALDIRAIIDDILRELKRLYWVVLALVLLLGAIFYINAKRTYVPYYTASASFTINVKMASKTSSSSYYNSATATQMARTFPYILTSGVLKKVVADDLGLPNLPASISAKALPDTNLFTITVTGGKPELVYNILESVIKNYLEVARVVIGDTEMTRLDGTGVPKAPNNPFQPLTYVQNGALTGLAIGLAIVVLFALTRTTLRRADDVNKLTNIRCLGSTPEVRFKKRSQNRKKFATINNRVVSNSFIEAMRYIRTRLDKLARQNNVKTIIITSAMPGEGKTTMAINIALSLARKENKVILIDFDLRNPYIAKTLGLGANYNQGVAGITDVLNGSVSLDEALKFYEHNLLILFGGEPTSDIDQLLENEAVHNLIMDLRDKADYVILDAAPCAILSDATVLAKYVDAGVFVVRQDHASKNRVLEGIENFAESNTPVLGYIFNCVSQGFSSYGYMGGNYSYRYGRYGKYGSSYGYKGYQGKEE